MKPVDKDPTISEDVIWWASIAKDMFNVDKKISKLEKTYLQVSYGSKNMLSVEDYLEILYHNIFLSDQFLLSSEIGQFLSGIAQNC